MKIKSPAGAAIALISVYLAVFILPWAVFFRAMSSGDGTIKKRTVKQLAELIELNELPECDMIYNDETHGGLLGDGHTAIICAFESEQAARLETMLAKAKHWSQLPMAAKISDLLYKDSEINVTTIESGYYFFYDKQTEDYFLADDFFDRASSNFRVSAYDSEMMLLYYYGLDT